MSDWWVNYEVTSHSTGLRIQAFMFVGTTTRVALQRLESEECAPPLHKGKKMWFPAVGLFTKFKVDAVAVGAEKYFFSCIVCSYL